MTRLPQPGSDAGQWGTILNDFLTQAHNTNGSLKSDSVSAVQLAPNSVDTNAIADASVTSAKLASGVLAGATVANGSITTGKLADDAVTNIKVDAATRVSLGKGDSASQPGHGHTIADVTNLQTTLDGKQSSGSYVPTSRTVAGHPLSSDVTITPADIGAATAAQGTKADSAVQPGSLATVATSGSYNDLTNKPVVSGDGGIIAVPITGNLTYTPTGLNTSQTYALVFTVNSTGGYTFTWGSGFVSATAETLPTISTLDNAETAVGCIYSAALAGWIPTLLYPTVVPNDVAPPTPGTLTASNYSSTGFTLTVAGASDVRGLASTPYEFSTNNGTTYATPQLGTTYVVTGLSASTTYACVVRVRDAAGNTATTTTNATTTSGAVITGAYTASQISATDASSYTFSSMAIGAASISRRVVVGFVWRAATAVTVSSVTAGGVTLIQAAATAQSTSSGAWIGYANVPTGTTATVVVTLSGTAIRAQTSLWTMDQPVIVSASGSGATSATVIVPTGGFAVASSIGQDPNGSSPGILTGFTQAVSTQIEQAGGTWFYGLGGHTSTTGSRTATLTGSTVNAATLAVAFTAV